MSKTLKVVLGVLAALSLCCGSCVIAGTLVDAGQVPGSITTELDGRYTCAMPGKTSALGVVTPSVTLAMELSISGGAYNGADGSVSLDGDVVRFTGGSYDGWRGLRDLRWGTTAIVFAQNKQALPAGPSALGSLRCTRRKD